jgi:hypothetical protein
VTLDFNYQQWLPGLAKFLLEEITMSKNGKEKKVPKEKKSHPFGPPEKRAAEYTFPSLNPSLFAYAGKSVASLPKNLQEVFEAVERHKDGVALKDLKVGKMDTRYLAWLCRQLCKHEYLRAKAEEKPEPKKAVKKAATKKAPAKKVARAKKAVKNLVASTKPVAATAPSNPTSQA